MALILAIYPPQMIVPITPEKPMRLTEPQFKILIGLYLQSSKQANQFVQERLADSFPKSPEGSGCLTIKEKTHFHHFLDFLGYVARVGDPRKPPPIVGRNCIRGYNLDFEIPETCQIKDAEMRELQASCLEEKLTLERALRMAVGSVPTKYKASKPQAEISEQAGFETKELGVIRRILYPFSKMHYEFLLSGAAPLSEGSPAITPVVASEETISSAPPPAAEAPPPPPSEGPLSDPSPDISLH